MSRTGAVVKDVAQMRISRCRTHLSSFHGIRIVGFFQNFFGVNRLGETRPAAARIKLVQRTEQRFAGHDVHINARCVVVPVGVVKCRLSGGFLGDAILHGVKFLFAFSDRNGPSYLWQNQLS